MLCFSVCSLASWRTRAATLVPVLSLLHNAEERANLWASPRPPLCVASGVTLLGLDVGTCLQVRRRGDAVSRRLVPGTPAMPLANRRARPAEPLGITRVVSSRS